MKCVVCRQGKTSLGTSSVTFERGGATLVFKSVPAKVCDNCGEAFVDSKTAARLLKKANEVFKAGVRVGVRDYAAV